LFLGKFDIMKLVRGKEYKKAATIFSFQWVLRNWFLLETWSHDLYIIQVCFGILSPKRHRFLLFSWFHRNTALSISSFFNASFYS